MYPNLIIFLILVIAGIILVHRETRKLESPLKERVRDICVIGIIMFACGSILKFFNKQDYQLIMTGLLVNIYGAVLFLYNEFKRSFKDVINSKNKK